MVITLRLDGREHALEIVARHPELVVRLDGRLHVLDAPGPEAGAIQSLVVDGQEVAFNAASDGPRVYVRHGGRSFRVDIADPRDQARSRSAESDEIVAEMPGTLLQQLKAAGDEVAAGETVLTIESMKLQMNLAAPRAGRIARVLVAVDQTFDKGATLVVLEPEAGS
jgi:acetyl/propionyl-CoA carboxylase alpha subunit